MRNNRNKLFLLSIASLPLFGGCLLYTSCEASAAALFVGFKQNLTGIQDVNNGAAGNVYYNAETGKLVLGGAQADVFDLSGKLVRSYNGVSQVAPSLPAGMYVVKARTANGTQSVKVSVK